MRVISGNLKGRVIKGFDISGTRPTMDRVKESVFGMIQNHLLNAIVLDLFAGTGNLGIEALSNGASFGYFNDKNKICTKIIEENLLNFNILEKSFITTLDYKEALDYYQKQDLVFDLIFLDPPYKEHIINEILLFIDKYHLLKNDGLVICECTEKEEKIDNYILYKEKKYGDKYIFIYQKKC